MAKKEPAFSTRQTGFSLVEIMVGLVVSLLVSLVIMQVFAVFEGQKRSSSGTADAQTNGHIALYNLQRDVQLAGYALPIFSSSHSPLQCTDFTPSGTDISPVSIIDGETLAGTGTGASDTVIVRYGDAHSGGSPATISSVSSGTVWLLNNAACQVGDTAIVSLGSACVFIENGVSSLTGTTGVTLDTTATISSGAHLSCLGHWKTISYAINAAQQLTRSENSDAASPKVAEIVSVQAQYGISTTANDNTVSLWVNATDAWAHPDIAQPNRIKALRVAIVARNGLPEKETVSFDCDTAQPNKPNGLCAWVGTTGSPAPPIDLSHLPNWQHYRYRVFSTIIPLRNIVWSKDALPT